MKSKKSIIHTICFKLNIKEKYVNFENIYSFINYSNGVKEQQIGFFINNYQCKTNQDLTYLIIYINDLKFYFDLLKEQKIIKYFLQTNIL